MTITSNRRHDLSRHRRPRRRGYGWSRPDPAADRSTAAGGPARPTPSRSCRGSSWPSTALRGPVSQLILSAQGWDGHPHRLGVAGRVVRLGYFASQPATLLTAICDSGGRVDLLVVPPDTPRRIAEMAMLIAAATDNVLPAQDILLAASTADPERNRPSARRRMGDRRRPPGCRDSRPRSGPGHVVLEHAQTRRSSDVSN